MIDEAESAKQEIDQLVNQAENAIDAGDEKHFDADPDSAARDYDDAIAALENARALAAESEPGRVERINHRLAGVQVRRQSLKSSEKHRTISSLTSSARKSSTAGDQAFRKSDYESALAEYEKANDYYESVAEVLREFSFEGSSNDPAVCDVCDQQFAENLDCWQTDSEGRLHVCPSCARFGPSGNLPNPREAADEHRSVVENIRSIRADDVGLDWTTSTKHSSDTVQTEDTRRDVRGMLIQLIGLYQTLGRPPTAAEVDGQTNFRYLDYEDEFGSIAAALHEGGMDVETE